jgi:NitT/TauT family transport system substrate-binding protein
MNIVGTAFARKLGIAALAAAFAAMVGAALPAPATAAGQKEPESNKVTMGITLATSTFLPIFLAEQNGYFTQEGLTVTVTGFRGGSDLTRAMVANSIDVGVASPAGVIGALQAGQDVKVFYGGFNQVPFDWYALPSIKKVTDLRGKTIGITRFGSSTDVLTRMVLAKAGLNPAKDVRIVQGGGSSERLAAMEAGQIAAGPFAEPHNFMAADRGFTRIARQSDFMPDYPVQSFFAKGPYIKDHPETLRRVLRAFVRGIRFAKANRDASIKILVDKVGIEKTYAARVYDAMIDGFHEDGRLGSEQGLKAFIDMGVASGEFEKAWPLNAYWVDTFHATYETWKP